MLFTNGRYFDIKDTYDDTCVDTTLLFQYQKAFNNKQQR